jgi:hypothetical protein
MKKKLFWSFGLIAITAFISINVMTASSNDKSSFMLCLSEVSAGAESGTCCPQAGAICIVGRKSYTDYYFLESGPCE